MPGTENGAFGKTLWKEEVYRAAYKLFRRKPDWVTFFRKILGAEGVVPQTYKTPESLAEFKRSEVYAEILGMLTRLRERPTDDDIQEPIRVVTVRLPRSVHESLRAEAYQRHTSMNQLCISKLLQFVENDLVPKERWERDVQTRTSRRAGGNPAEQVNKKRAGADL